MNLRDSIKKIIADRGMTSVQVAERLKMTKGTFSRVINKNPTVDTLEKIANAIGCKVGDFFLDETSTCEHSSPTLICPNCGAKLNINLDISLPQQ